MRGARIAAAAGVAGLSLTLAACGGGEGSAPGGSDPDDTTPTTSSSTPSEAAVDSDYLPVPEGVTLTEAGADLALKDTATAAWEPRQDLIGVVDVTVTRIEVSSIEESFAGFEVDEAAAASTPYFVSVKAVNVGDTDLGARRLPIYIVDSGGDLVEPTGIDQDFAPCPEGDLPAIFAPGDQTKSCLVFLAPDGASLSAVMFRPPEGVVPLTWRGDVKPARDGNRRDRREEREGRGEE